MVEPTLLQSYVKILTVVSLYWFVSITLVFVNKSLLSGATKLEAPLFVTFFQCVVTIVACYAIKAVSVKFPNKVNIFHSNVCSFNTDFFPGRNSELALGGS